MKIANGRFKCLIAILFILLWTACSDAPFSAEQTADPAPQTARQLDNDRQQNDESPELETLVGAIEDGAYGKINSLLIWQDSELQLDAYFRGNRPDQLHPVFSVTKSITSAAVGVALAEGHIPAVDSPLAELLPEYDQLQTVEKQTITLEHVLTMETGFEWDESSVIYGQPGNDASEMFRSSDWIAFVLERELITQPGETFVYNSGNTVLLSGVLEDGTAVSAEEYVAEKIFTPLGIDNWRWEKNRDGLTNTGWGLHLTSEDMLKFGILFLNKGNWEGEQIIPADWVAASTAPQLVAGENTSYGYQWWRFNEGSHWIEPLPSKDVFFAWGFGGNFIWVVPERNAVIVSTGENFAESTQIFDALETAIFPWLVDSP